MTGCAVNNKPEKESIYSEEKTDSTLNKKSDIRRNSSEEKIINEKQTESNDAENIQEQVSEESQKEETQNDIEKKKEQNINQDTEIKNEESSDLSDPPEEVIVREENEMEVIPDE